MKTNVSFTGEFPVSPDDESPECLGTAIYLSERLRQMGVQVHEPQQIEVEAHVGGKVPIWCIECVVDDKPLLICVRLFDMYQLPRGVDFLEYISEPDNVHTQVMLVSVDSKLSFMARLRGQRDQQERKDLCWKIHEILHADQRFRDIEWFKDQNSRSEGTQTPS